MASEQRLDVLIVRKGLEQRVGSRLVQAKGTDKVMNGCFVRHHLSRYWKVMMYNWRTR